MPKSEAALMQPLPFRYRLRAWWEGYDLRQLPQRLFGGTPAANETADDRPRRADIAPLPVQRRAHAPAADAQMPTGWTPPLLAAGQIIWGENSLSPRGDEQLKALAVKAGLGPRSRVIHLGAELGGTAALLERGLGCKVAAAETLPEIAAESAGRVVHVKPEDGPILASPDFVLVDGIAERGEPLATIVRNQTAGLSPQGLFVLRGLVLMDERAASSARFRDWAATEPVRPRLRTADELTRILQEGRLTVMTSVSIADDYAEEVEYCWGSALDRIRALHRDPTGRMLIPTLLGECERWLKRIELVREGVIGVRLITAARRDRAR